MVREKLNMRQWLYLTGMLLTAVLCLLLTRGAARSEKRELYDTALEAAQRMENCMQCIKEEKAERGIALSAEDSFKTGMIGEDFNFITTTLGDPASKRTTASTDMAALMVFMLDKAGLEKGDTLGCNFSGSFPALNIAVLCACDAMGIRPVYICSCGASTWGANNPELSFPEMAAILHDKGLTVEPPALVTPGGGDDVGGGVDADMFSEIWQRAVGLGYPTMTERDLEANVLSRKAIFDSEGIDAFLAAGGNISSLGGNMVTDLLGQGIIRESISALNASSGLLERYLYEQLPCILLLNIRQLTADWGMPFDPVTQAPAGTASIYYTTVYPWVYCAVCLGAELALMLLFRKEKRANAKAV